MTLTDFHSHCLPNMDDGAANVQMAVAMLRSSAEQGVTRVMATPHFYIGQHSAADFFRERKRAYEELKPHLTEGMPEIEDLAKSRFPFVLLNHRDLKRDTAGNNLLHR